MLDVEMQAQDALPPGKRDRFEFLLNMRNALARTVGELCCWGVGFDNYTMIDRQQVLLEDAVLSLVSDPHLAATLSAEWAVHDASLLHHTGMAKDWCAVCQHGGYRIEDLLGNVSAVLG